MKIGNKNFDTENNVYIMGILNVTPDSFSDGGKYNLLDKALLRTEEMIAQGADIIDVGGESTRPNYTPISAQTEIERVLPVVEKIRENFDTAISLDTYKSEVVQAAARHIDMVNDIRGLKYDGKMAGVVAAYGLCCCLMHHRASDGYSDFFADFISDMKESLTIAENAGIPKENIILDAGVGFRKSYEQNLIVINRTERLCELGCPVMIAASRKSVIGLSLDKPHDQRLYGTIASTVLGVAKGASFVRVHDIGENDDAIRLTKSILEERKWIKSK